MVMKSLWKNQEHIWAQFKNILSSKTDFDIVKNKFKNSLRTHHGYEKSLK